MFLYVLDIHKDTNKTTINQLIVNVLFCIYSIFKQFLNKIAKALKIPVEAIKNFNEEAAINIISNTFQDDASLNNYTNHYKCNFNPIDKVVELYDKLLQAEKEKVAMLQEVLRDKR